MRVSYIKIGKKDRNTEIQRRDFEEQVSSRKADRPELRMAPELYREVCIV